MPAELAFFNWTIFKVFIAFVTILLLICFGFQAWRHHGISSLTRNQTCTLCVERWSKPLTARLSPRVFAFCVVGFYKFGQMHSYVSTITVSWKLLPCLKTPCASSFHPFLFLPERRAPLVCSFAFSRMSYISKSFWTASLSNMYLRFLHVFLCLDGSFFFIAKYHYTDVPLFIGTYEGHLG